eukprot:scaffold22538_cov58-Cyclotella_meneghiniana.AAC.5
MKYYSILILATMLTQSHGSIQNPSRSIRGSPIESNINTRQLQLSTQGGCTENSECPDNYFCHVADGDCLSGYVVGECYEMRVSRTRRCDGVTYTDRSWATGAGVNVLHQGACDDKEIA